jgi:hypothetical protein
MHGSRPAGDAQGGPNAGFAPLHQSRNRRIRYTFPSLNNGPSVTDTGQAPQGAGICGMTACSSLESAAARVIPVRARLFGTPRDAHT